MAASCGRVVVRVDRLALVVQAGYLMAAWRRWRRRGVGGRRRRRQSAPGICVGLWLLGGWRRGGGGPAAGRFAGAVGRSDDGGSLLLHRVCAVCWRS